MSSSDQNPAATPASGGPAEPSPPGRPTAVSSQVLDAGARLVQSLKPVRQMKQHACSFALYAHDLHRQMEVHHFVSRLNQDVLQCAVYDSDKPSARLIGVEYIVSDSIFEGLPPDEQRLWHSHAYEVKAGLWTDVGVPESLQSSEMASLAKTYGKLWCTWQVDRGDIRKNPVFRQQFHEMCAKVGVDPLASNKGVWAELLGIGDFYYELGVQIVDICIATRSHNGGLIDLLDLRKLLGQKRKATLESLSEDDCLRAISKLKVLGSGFEVISVGRRKLVRSVPTELNKDHSGILGLAQAEGYVTVEQVEREFSWSTGRAIDALETLLKEGLAMIDDGHRDGKRRYWFPCVTVSSDTAAVEAKS